MSLTTNTIDHTALEHLVEAGAIHGASVIGHPGGWGVVVQCGVTERALAARRGAIRTFRRFETLVGYLKEVGITQYHVDAANFDAAALKTTRVTATLTFLCFGVRLEPIAQCVINARLPTSARPFECPNDICVQSNVDVLLRAAQSWTATLWLEHLFRCIFAHKACQYLCGRARFGKPLGCRFRGFAVNVFRVGFAWHIGSFRGGSHGAG